MRVLGKLTKLSVRQAWSHEAHDFTPWVKANANELGEILGMDLELTEAEHGVGAFSLDLMGKDLATGDSVIIENQLERSDHNHLGQLLTYAGGTDAKNIVWIADSFRNEHRAALDWLNERTDEHTRFFAVEVSAVQIGDSAIAPLFEVVVQPNDWQKEVRAQTVSNTRGLRQETYREFWTLFLDELNVVAPRWTNAKTPLAQNWMNLPAGMSAVNYAVAFGKNGPRVEIYFASASAEVNEANFQQLLSRRHDIEHAFGDPLSWDVLEGRKASRVACERTGDIDMTDQWPDYVDWFVTTAVRLRAAIDGLGGMRVLLNPRE